MTGTQIGVDDIIQSTGILSGNAPHSLDIRADGLAYLVG